MARRYSPKTYESGNQILKVKGTPYDTYLRSRPFQAGFKAYRAGRPLTGMEYDNGRDQTRFERGRQLAAAWPGDLTHGRSLNVAALNAIATHHGAHGVL
ncbi:MAG: hypothetical protein KDI55_00280 [Anaerolineae bacterium]|nr:hypothetical protein [Anaerolineae bacterium]